MHEALHLASARSLRSSSSLNDINGSFRDHAHAAQVLIELGILQGESQPHLVAFTPGGHTIAREIERICEIPLTQAAVAEFSPPWPGGPVFGAAAFDGTVTVDEELRELCSVSRKEFLRLVECAYERVSGIIEANEGVVAFPALHGQTALVVDDGWSAPLAIRSAMAAVRHAGASRVVLVLPVGQRRSVRLLSRSADLTYCASLRSSRSDLSDAYDAPLGRLASTQRRKNTESRAL